VFGELSDSLFRGGDFGHDHLARFEKDNSNIVTQKRFLSIRNLDFVIVVVEGKK